MNLNNYQEDEKRQLSGAKVEIDGAMFTIKRFGTRESDIFMADLRKKKYNPYAVISDGEKQHLENEIFGEWLAKYAVVGWVGVYCDGLIDEITDNVSQFKNLPEPHLYPSRFFNVENNQGSWVLFNKKPAGIYQSNGLGWQLIKNPTYAEELPYSKKAAYDIFTNPEYYLSLNNKLIQKAVDFREFLHVKVADEVAEIKPRLKFDVDHPTLEEKQSYLKHCDALNADSGISDLTDIQTDLLNALYRADRNRDKDSALKDKQIREQVELVALDEDIAISIIQHLDCYLLECRNNKIKRESKQ